jgi:hypothetical protein
MYSFLATLLSIPTTFAAPTTGGGNVIPVETNPTVTSVPFTGPFANETVESVLSRLAGYAVTVGASVATIMVLYGAFEILTSRGDVKKFQAGRKTIIYALSGLVIVILAKGLVALFATLTHNLGI